MQTVHHVQIENLEVSGLPPREALVLAHTALGHSTKATARSMECTARNVENLRSSARDRLMALNTANLVAVAFQKGILRFLSVLLVIFGTGLSISQPVTAQSDDPFARRIRCTRARRGTRRVSRGLPPPSMFNQLYIEYFNLQAVLEWEDDEMHVHYLPTSPMQTKPYAQIFNVDDLMRWHSEQFYQSLTPRHPETTPGGSHGQASADRSSGQAAGSETLQAAPDHAREESH